MKTKLLSLASILAVFNLNAIEIGPTGSGVEMSGFVVMDYVNDDGNGATDDSSFMLSEVELNFDYSTGPVSFALDVEVYKNGAGTPNASANTFVEEAVLTYSFSDSLSVSAGRMLSYLGFEAYDAPNMYQISSAYKTGAYGYLYDGYADGVSVDFATDMFAVGIWADLFEQNSFEYSLAYTGVENLTAKYIYADYGASSESKQTIWASYQMGSLLLGGEIAAHEDNGGTAGDDTDAYLIMGNYGFTDSFSLTLRLSSTETVGTQTSEVEVFTVSPTYMVTDSLALLAEYSDIEDSDEFFGIEAIFTF
jgi:hypothetical protein